MTTHDELHAPHRSHDVGGGAGSLAHRAAQLLFPVSPRRVRALVDDRRSEGREAVAEHVVNKLAGRSAAYGALTGLPGGIAGVVLLGLDARGAWGATATIAAARHYFDDPAFFDRDDWWLRTLQTTLGAADLRAASVGRGALQKVALERGVRWGARRIVARIVPVAGAVVSAGWNYAWVRREGERIFQAPDVGMG